MKNALALLALIVATPAMAIPDVVTWAARVENDAGAFNGNMTVTFGLFDVLTAGTSLWSETATSVVVLDGDAVHDIGSVEALDDSIINRDNLFLEVTMNGDVLAPRSALRAVPYALRATNAASAAQAGDSSRLGGLAPSTFQFTAAAGGGLALSGTQFSIPPLAITNARIADAAVTLSKIAPNSVDGNKVADNSLSSADLGLGSVTSSELAANAVTEASINGTLLSIFTRPVGCGGGLQADNAACRTLACGEDLTFNGPLGAFSSAEVEFLSCDGTSCSANDSLTCVVTLIGKMLPTSF